MLLDQVGVRIVEGKKVVFDRKLIPEKNLLAGEVVEVKEVSLDPSTPQQVKTIVIMVPFVFNLPMAATQTPGIYVVGEGVENKSAGPKLISN